MLSYLEEHIQVYFPIELVCKLAYFANSPKIFLPSRYLPSRLRIDQGVVKLNHRLIHLVHKQYQRLLNYAVQVVLVAKHLYKSDI